MKRTIERLVSVHMLERRDEDLDDLGHFLWHWTYPSIESSVRGFIEKRLHSKATHPNSMTLADSSFDFYKLHNNWIYVQSGLDEGTRHHFVLRATDFYPHTYRKLLCTFAEMFQQKMSLRRFLHYYLSLLIKGEITIHELNNLPVSLLQRESADSVEAHRWKIKSIIQLFHLDVILIYTALLLKRKIAIYHHCQSTLLDFMVALPAFVSHRPESQMTQVFQPNVDLHSPEQIETFRGGTHYIATFQDPKIREREELYDLMINLAACEITISHKAREIFSMTKTHKEVAIALVRIADNEAASSEDVINEITKKTTELYNSLNLFAKDEISPSEESPKCRRISKVKLKQKLLSPNLESFYWNLAVAEGIADDDLLEN